MRTHPFVAVCFAVVLCCANHQPANTQVTTDSLKRMALQGYLAANRAETVAAVMQLQAVLLNDSLTLFLNRNAEAIKKFYGDTSLQYGTALGTLGLTHFWKGEYQLSLQFLRQSAAVLKTARKEDDVVYATVINNIGKTYARLGNSEKALAYCTQAKDIRKRTLKKEDKWFLLYPVSLDDLAALYTEKNRFDSALVLYKESLQTRRELYGEGHPYYALGVNNLGLLYAARREYKKALPLLSENAAVLRSAFGSDDVEYNLALEQLALLHRNMGHRQQALSAFRQVQAWRKKAFGEGHPLYAQCLLHTATLTDDIAAAATLFCDADKILLAHLRSTYTSLSEEEKVRYSTHTATQFGYLPSLLFLNHATPSVAANQAYENELVLKGMVLEDQQQVLRSIRQSHDGGVLPLYKQWRYNKALSGKFLLSPKTKKFFNTDSVADLANRLEQQLSAASAEFRRLRHAQRITAAEISGKLKKNEAAIEFVRFCLYNKKWTGRTVYAALVRLPNDTVTKFVSLCEETQLLRLLKTPSGANAGIFTLYPPDSTSAAGACSALYKLIWQPLEKHLHGVRTVYYAPAGLLHRISFQALRRNGKQLLIDAYQLNQLLSTRSVVWGGDSTTHLKTAAVWGGIQYTPLPQPSFANAAVAKENTGSLFNFYTKDMRGLRRDGEWTPLPGTRKEIENIRETFESSGMATNTYSGAEATEEAFKALDGKSPQVLHVATHGFFLPVAKTKVANELETQPDKNVFTVQQNPMLRSGLVLAGGNRVWAGKAALPGREDGILTAYEISLMDLSNTELVVLSACETAGGDLQGAEGVIGLQRAFKLAGAKQLLLSLWHVPDKETTKLMTLFYKNRLSGQTTREALRAAQLAMRKKYPPYYWAGFVMVE